MANIATILKSEIGRIAGREVRSETQRLKKVSGHYRSDIAALKRRVLALEQQIKRLSKAAPRQVPRDVDDGPALVRFTANGFASQRRRLGLSVEEFGSLLGVSGQSVRKWEYGKAHPRKAQLPAIAAARKMGKKQAAARLQELRG